MPDRIGMGGPCVAAGVGAAIAGSGGGESGIRRVGRLTQPVAVGLQEPDGRLIDDFGTETKARNFQGVLCLGKRCCRRAWWPVVKCERDWYGS